MKAEPVPAAPGLRVALLSEKYPPDPGGLAVSVERLAQLLLAAGHSPQVLCLSADLLPGQAHSESRAGVPVLRLGEARRAEKGRPDTGLSDWYDAVLQAHRQAPFDLLQAYFITKAGFVGVYAARTLGIPCVVSARGNDLERAVFDPARAAHTLYALQAADALTANAHSLAQRAQALAPGRAVTLIPNGVDGRRFRPQAAGPALRVELGLPADGPVIGFSGEARAKKGLAVLLVAFRLLAERRAAAGAPPPGLLLLGGVRPGDDEALVRVFRKQHPALCVVQTEPLPQAGLADYYALMDVLALPSLHDGLPNALLEGMACGRAVAACPAGGIADVLVDGQNGLLSPPGDAGALAENLQRLLDDADLRARLGAEARRCVLAQYTPEAELHATLQVYRGCLAAHRLKEAR